MALLKVSLQTLKTVISCDLTWHAGVGWEAYFVMFSLNVCECENNNLTFASSICCTVSAVMEKCGNVVLLIHFGKVFWTH